MRALPATLIAAASAAAIAGVAVAAQQPSAKLHTIAVRIPDGGVATITYSGDVAPRVGIEPGPTAFFAPHALAFWPAFAPAASDGQASEEVESPFAVMERMTAEMDREVAALLARATAETSMRGGLDLAPGAGGYSFASATPGSGVCMQSVEITSAGDGSAPKVVRRASGDCGGAKAGGAAVTAIPRADTPAGSPTDGPRFYQTAWRRGARDRERAATTDATLHMVSESAD